MCTGVRGGRKDGGELLEAKGGEEADDVGVVGEVEVEALIEGKGDCIII